MFNATLVRRIDITKDLFIAHVKPDETIRDFLPGQYVALGLPASAPRPEHFPPEPEAHAGDKLIKRAYSIGSAPSEKGYLEFYIAILPEGALTSRLALIKPGDRMYAAPKITGTFTLEGTPADANLVFVATGTGIAPFMSMLRCGKTWQPDRRIALLHGVRYASDLAYADEVQALAGERGNLSYHPIVSRADERWSGARGHVQSLFGESGIALDAARDHVFLCGNPAMIDDMEKLLLAKGYTEHSRKVPGNMHLERYW